MDRLANCFVRFLDFVANVMDQAIKHSSNCPVCGSEFPELIWSTNTKLNGTTTPRKIYKCSLCTHMYAVQKGTQVAGLANKFYLEKWSTAQKTRHGRLGHYLYYSNLIMPGDSVLDVGAGRGGLSVALNEISKRYSFGVSIHLVEPFEELNRFLLNFFEQDSVFSDISQLSKTYDFIIMHEMLEHVEEPKKLIEEICPYIHSGTMFYVTVPGHSTSEKNLVEANSKDFSAPDHIQYYTLQSIKTLFSQIGFQRIRQTRIDDFYPSWAQRPLDFTKRDRSLKTLSEWFGNDGMHIQLLVSGFTQQRLDLRSGKLEKKFS